MTSNISSISPPGLTTVWIRFKEVAMDGTTQRVIKINCFYHLFPINWPVPQLTIVNEQPIYDIWAFRPFAISSMSFNQLPSHAHGPLNIYVKLRIVHAPGMPGTFPWPPTSNETASFRSRTCRGACRDRLPAVAEKTSPVFPAHAQAQFYVSGIECASNYFTVDKIAGWVISCKYLVCIFWSAKHLKRVDSKLSDSKMFTDRNEVTALMWEKLENN